jgi:hypothetical protein
MRGEESQDQLAQLLADRLVLYATQCMWDKRRVSPFEGEFFAISKFHFLTLHQSVHLELVNIGKVE